MPSRSHSSKGSSSAWQERLDGETMMPYLPPPNPWLTLLLKDACREYQIAAPVFQIVSDRRGELPSGITYMSSMLTHIGGRTAWSSRVTVHGSVHNARFWYDGKNLNNAKEDAAEVAYNWLSGSNPSSPSTNRGGW
jgi:hypothetical protein